MKLLLHTCCGPCFLGVWEELSLHPEIETTLYYFNPNIYPEEEFKKRLQNLKLVADQKSLPLITTDWQNGLYNNGISQTGAIFPSRCLGCYRIRLLDVAKYAKLNGYDAFSTTLFVSPYQQHKELRQIGEEIEKIVGIKFYYTDWRPFFRKGQTDAKTLGIYRQRYCGCQYSLSESSVRP